MVLIYEGIVNGVFDYDYAPAPDIVGGKRVYMNISQEGRDDLDDLREGGMLYSLKLSSKKYQSTVAMRITALGEDHLVENLTDEDREAVEGVVYAPDTERTNDAKLRVRWDPDEMKFFLYSATDYERESSITDIESVSYVSSPYIPDTVRPGDGRENASNENRIEALKNAASNIKDELDENLTCNDLHLLIGEWIPMGVNQVVALNDRLGSSERVAGGFFTAVVDMEPDATEFIGQSDGLTEVDILDFDETTFVNFEAEVHFEEEDGIVQVENFGVHINEEGFLMYGMVCNGIMHAIKDRLSLDNLSRLLVDVQMDSSKIVDNLMSPHQRVMLDLTYLNDAPSREKYNVIMCRHVNKEEDDDLQLKAEHYLDKEANENELKQVIGDTHAAYDLSDTEVLVVGRNGMLLASADFQRFEPHVVCYLSLMTRNMFMRSLFQRTFILADVLKHIRELIDDHESDPNSIGTIRNLLSEVSGDIILLSEIQSYLNESLTDVQLPESGGDPALRRLQKIFEVSATHKRLMRRVRDMKKNIDGSAGEVRSLRDMANVVSEAREFRTAEAVRANTKNLEDVFRANERASASLEIMQVVLAGSLAFDILDRLHGLYLGIAGEIDWANDFFGPVYKAPGALFLVNMAWWGVVGGFIKYILWKLGDEASGILSVRFKVNVKIDIDRFQAMMEDKNPEVEDSDADKSTLLKKFAWDESDRELWKGHPPRIEVYVDMKYAFLLSAFIQVATKKSESTHDDVRVNFFSMLREQGVIDGYMPGIEVDADDPRAVSNKKEEDTPQEPGIPSPRKSGKGDVSGFDLEKNTDNDDFLGTAAGSRSLSVLISKSVKSLFSQKRVQDHYKTARKRKVGSGNDQLEDDSD